MCVQSGLQFHCGICTALCLMVHVSATGIEPIEREVAADVLRVTASVFRREAESRSR